MKFYEQYFLYLLNVDNHSFDLPTEVASFIEKHGAQISPEISLIISKIF